MYQWPSGLLSNVSYRLLLFLVLFLTLMSRWLLGWMELFGWSYFLRTTHVVIPSFATHLFMPVALLWEQIKLNKYMYISM